jgi:hypothetical protein
MEVPWEQGWLVRNDMIGGIHFVSQLMMDAWCQSFRLADNSRPLLLNLAFLASFYAERHAKTTSSPSVWNHMTFFAFGSASFDLQQLQESI